VRILSKHAYYKALVLKKPGKDQKSRRDSQKAQIRMDLTIQMIGEISGFQKYSHLSSAAIKSCCWATRGGGGKENDSTNR